MNLVTSNIVAKRLANVRWIKIRNKQITAINPDGWTVEVLGLDNSYILINGHGVLYYNNGVVSSVDVNPSITYGVDGYNSNLMTLSVGNPLVTGRVYVLQMDIFVIKRGLFEIQEI